MRPRGIFLRHDRPTEGQLCYDAAPNPEAPNACDPACPSRPAPRRRRRAAVPGIPPVRVHGRRAHDGISQQHGVVPDRLVAGQSSKLRTDIEAAIAAGDLAKARRLLEPIARQAGQIADLNRELAALAKGSRPPDPPQPQERKEPPPARRKELARQEPPAEPATGQAEAPILSVISQPPPRSSLPVVLAQQTKWVPYEGRLRSASTAFRFKGRIRRGDDSAGKDDEYPKYELFDRASPRFAPLVRVCSYGDCEVLNTHGDEREGYETAACSREFPKIDRVEFYRTTTIPGLGAATLRSTGRRPTAATSARTRSRLSACRTRASSA